MKLSKHLSLYKKKSFTLIEIIIGFLLAALLIGGLFEIQRQFNLLQNKVEQTKQIVFGRQRFYSRLAQIFNRLDKCWVDGTSLVLEYTDDLDPDREFRGKCLALLHHTDNALFLTTYAKGAKQEILLKIDKHATVSFELFDTKSPRGIKEWSADIFEKKLPDLERRMLKITIDMPKKGKIEFPFWIQQP